VKELPETAGSRENDVSQLEKAFNVWISVDHVLQGLSE
jgi:hypothetical protein